MKKQYLGENSVSTSTRMRYPQTHVIEVEPGTTNHDLVVKISHTKTGREFAFTLKGHYLIPQPKRHLKGNGDFDWYDALSEQERVDLMDVVLAHYRKPSADKDGMKTSSVGIVPNPDPRHMAHDKHLIYVSFNTPDPENNYLKNCAEKNTVNEASMSMRGFMVHKREMLQPELPKFIEFHVMGGRDPDPAIPGDKGVASVCPCGQCTDRLANAMVEGGKIYVHPHAPSGQAHKINHSGQTGGAQHFGEVAKDEVWATTIDLLNQNRRVTLTDDVQKIQEDGRQWLIQALAHHALPEVSDAVVEQEGKNKRQHRRSISELDLATKDGKPDVAVLADVMRWELVKTLLPRLRRDYDGQVPSDENVIRLWLEKRVTKVSCDIIQTDDGCYHWGKDSQTGSDNAFVDSGISGLSMAIDSLGDHGVEKIWSIEYDPKALREQRITTPSKESCERAHKRRTRENGKTMTIAAIPLCDNQMIKNVNKIQLVMESLTFTIPQIMPGGFDGSGVTTSRQGGGIFERFINRAPSNGMRI